VLVVGIVAMADKELVIAWGIKAETSRVDVDMASPLRVWALKDILADGNDGK
jgi:hypothetical protein